MASSRARAGIGVAISVAALWLAFRSVPLDALAASLTSADYWWLAAYPPLAVTLNVVRAEIWRRLLSNRAPAVDAFWAYCVGFLVNNVMPFRLGEAARVVALSTRCRIPVVEVATAAGIERLCDMAAIAVILIAVLPFVAHVDSAGRAAWWAIGLVVLVALILGSLVVGRDGIDRLVKRVCRKLFPTNAEVLIGRWRELVNTLSLATEPRVAGPVLAGCATVWVLTLILQWTVLRAFQPDAALPDAAVLVALVSIGGAVPAAPGALGTYQWIGQQALTIPFPERYPPALALAAAVVSHAASYLFSTLLGLIGTWYLGVRVRQLQHSMRPEPQLSESRL